MFLFLEEKKISSIHFVGILGIGMSAIAQYLVGICTVSGSDRSLDAPEHADTVLRLRAMGISLNEQDGTGIHANTDALVISTAIEDSNPDLCRAKEEQIPLYHRSEVLAEICRHHYTISVTGTSGKSSVSALIFHVLHAAGKKPSVITGAHIHSLREQGLVGNALRDTGDVLVIEADESDGTVVRYHPEISVLLNVSRDHKEIHEIVSLMAQAAQQSKYCIKNADDPHLEDLSGICFGFSPQAEYFPERWSTAAHSVSFTIENTTCIVNQGGKHTIINALAAFATCRHYGVSTQEIANALSTYNGIARRFDCTMARDGIVVIDDYAHNPEKIAAALETAQGLGNPVYAIFQPHGFGPLAFMFDDLVDMFRRHIRPQDILILLPTYYVGGTAQKTIDSPDLAQALGDPQRFFAVNSRDTLLEFLQKKSLKDTSILLAGARDSSLPLLAKTIAERV